jgi:hypothetical protein
MQIHLRTITFGSTVLNGIDFLQSSSKSPRKLYVFLHDRDSFGVQRTEVGVLEKMHQECLGGLLQCLDGLRLPSVAV